MFYSPIIKSFYTRLKEKKNSVQLCTRKGKWIVDQLTQQFQFSLLSRHTLYNNAHIFMSHKLYLCKQEIERQQNSIIVKQFPECC